MKKIISVLSVFLIGLLVLSGCESDKETSSNVDENGIKTFTAFMAVPGKELPDDNRMMNKIAEKIGAKADVTWLTGQTASERIGVMIAGGEYPDFIDGSDGTAALINAGALIPLEDYLDDYPNIKNLYTDAQWNQIRNEDGHIYIIPQFGIVKGENMAVQHNDEAFWIQKRILEWADYPEITTLDEYFDLIESYLKENPTLDDGQKNIGFSILSDDWRYFCLENPPQFLAGYPNDGAAVIDPVTKEAKVYDKIPEAKEYYKILSEKFANGIIDPETFTMSYDQYIAKISSGRVLGMVDQHWQFQDAENSLKSQGLEDLTYVPLDLVLDESVTPQYFSPPTLNVANGLGISISNKDVEGSLKFLNELLDPEVMVMRTWGEEGVDYEVDDKGVFYRTEEQRNNAKDQNYVTNNFSDYNYFPTYGGMMEDGINAVSPGEQPDEFYATLSDLDRKILDAYGYKKWTDFLTPVEENAPWYPIYSATNGWTASTPEGISKEKMTEVKQQWLPKVIMTSPDKFESAWNDYMDAYDSQVDVKAYEDALTKEVQRRIEVAESTN